MKQLTLSLLACMAGAASLMISSASAAATLSPPRTRSTFRGTLRFYPADTKQAAFKCRVKFVMRTGNGEVVGPKEPKIDSAVGLNCPLGFFFDQLPWGAGANPNGVNANVFPFGWAKQGGPSCNVTFQTFSVDANGVWTTTGPCVRGSLTSDPPITIAP